MSSRTRQRFRRSRPPPAAADGHQLSDDVKTPRKRPTRQAAEPPTAWGEKTARGVAIQNGSYCYDVAFQLMFSPVIRLFDAYED
jgi:hypothetical protein